MKRRRPSARVALFAAGGIGLASALTFTMAQWTDEATITGTITTGDFEITVTPDELDFEEFVPEVSQTSEHTLTNESSVDAIVDLDIAGFPTGGPSATDWDLTVALDNGPAGAFAERYSGDPSGGVSGIQLDGGPGGAQDLVLEPGESVNIEITLELSDDSDGSQDITLDDVEFTFNGEQVTD